jgi:hypothetical protein
MITFVDRQQVYVSSINTTQEGTSFNTNYDADGVEEGHITRLFYYI